MKSSFSNKDTLLSPEDSEQGNSPCAFRGKNKIVQNSPNLVNL